MDSQQIKDVVGQYLDAVSSGDPDKVVALYAPDATVEDPVGTDVHRGLDAIRGFYAGAAQLADRLTCTLTTPVNVAAGQAAFGFTIRAETGDSGVEIFSIDLMTFDDEGRITSMRAFWDPADVRPL